MMTAEDCRRKAAEHLQASQEASDPSDSQSLRRLSDAWATLAGQIEKDPHTVRQRNTALKQSQQTEPHKANTGTVQVADSFAQRAGRLSSAVGGKFGRFCPFWACCPKACGYKAVTGIAGQGAAGRVGGMTVR